MNDRTVPQPPVSAAILAGGAATRMGGAKKALLDVGGRTILERLLDALGTRFAEVLVVAKDAGDLDGAPRPEGLPWRLALDGRPERSSLTGLCAALANARTDHVFVTACDTPFLKPALIDALLAQLAPEDDVVLPQKPDGYFEPLCAVYSRRCLPHIEAQMAAGDFKIVDFFGQVRVRPLPVPLLLAADPALASFENANTPDELRSLRETAAAPHAAKEVP